MNQPNGSQSVRVSVATPTNVTNCILEDLERGVRPWLTPWSAYARLFEGEDGEHSLIWSRTKSE
jgi:antirestriction protein ArdC